MDECPCGGEFVAIAKEVLGGEILIWYGCLICFNTPLDVLLDMIVVEWQT
jgi:hypothetical protein